MRQMSIRAQPIAKFIAILGAQYLAFIKASGFGFMRDQCLRQTNGYRYCETRKLSSRGYACNERNSPPAIVCRDLPHGQPATTRLLAAGKTRDIQQTPQQIQDIREYRRQRMSPPGSCYLIAAGADLTARVRECFVHLRRRILARPSATTALIGDGKKTIKNTKHRTKQRRYFALPANATCRTP